MATKDYNYAENATAFSHLLFPSIELCNIGHDIPISALTHLNGQQIQTWID